MAQNEGLLDVLQIESKKRKRAIMSSSFKRCKTTIKKKAYELSTLCDTPICVIIYGPNDDVPSCVWPTDPRQVNHTLAQYLKTTNKTLKPRPVKSKDGVGGTQVKNLPSFEGVATGVIIDNLSGEQLVELGNRLKSKIAVVNAKIDAIKRGQCTTMTVKFDQNVEYFVVTMSCK
ncbi:hypothetical protein vseg_015350 [Gypsophila vaccaria]